MRKQRRQQRNRLQLKLSYGNNVLSILKENKKIIVYFTVALCFALFFSTLSIVTYKRFWDGESKVSLAISKSEGAAVLLFDPQYDQVTKIVIPKSTEVEVANQLGVWKIDSVWELGKQQKLGGELLADTITKQFRFPVTAWAEEDALKFADGSLNSLFHAVFGRYATNLTMGDKVSLAIFSMRVPNARRVEIDLSQSSFLTKKELRDGTEGYVLSKELPQSVLSLFSEDNLSNDSFLVSISDATGQQSVAQDVGNVVEVLGAKVALIEKQEKSDFDCIVKGKNTYLVERISEVFDCIKEDGSSKFDTEVFLGESFGKRF